MKYSDNSALLSVFLLGCVVASGCAYALRAVDPLFGVVFSPATVQFDAAPASLLEICPALASARWTREMFVFASTGKPLDGGAYVVVGGYFVERGPHGERETDPAGVLLALNGTSCRLIGPAREVFDFGEEGVPTAALMDLAADAAHRYKRAWGGPGQLRAALHRHGVIPSAIQSVPLRVAFSSVLEQSDGDAR